MFYYTDLNRRGVYFGMKFDYMCRDKICSTIEVEHDKVKVTDYVDNFNYKAFGMRKNITIEDVEDFLEDRCVPRTRANINEILAIKGYPGYMPLLILRDTHGVLCEDEFWIRFEGETLTWDDVKIKGWHKS